MTRPTIVRADTIDLQNHSAPSAQDHPSQHHLPEPAPGSSTAPIAPHQAETLREVAHETAEEEARSPRLSWTSGKGGGTGAVLQQHDDDSDDEHDRGSSGGGLSRALAGGINGSDMYRHDHQQQQQDALAVAQNGGVSSSDEGDLDGDGDTDLDDDMMDKISSSPSIEDEDIDFEFVYALHTFVATVEGQANATKGDTMVLLDDSNSYWWLVRVVKDSSIGYLPAEHIETPTERLARLNKHRNIDLSATMLGDQAAKQKNSFKGIRRRRKTVTFAEPTYVDYSDFDYSTDEEDIEELFGPHPTTAQQQREPQKQEQQQSALKTPTEDEATDESAKVEPLKTRATSQDTVAESAKEEPAGQEEVRGSDELLENKPDSLIRSRNGTVRNTDSFFKDESVETKKITLTPNLLRDDNTPRDSSESVTKDLKSRTSLDKLDKELLSDKERKKGKDKDKKDKDKKPSVIRSFFSRKDKKKAAEDDDESFGKRSMDIISESRDSEDRAVDEQAPADKSAGAQRNPGKLQKVAPAGKAPGGTTQKSVELSSYLAEGRNNDVSNVPPSSMRIVDPETQETQEVPSNQQQQTGDATRERSPSAAAQREEKSVISKIMLARSASAGQDPKPQKTVKAKARMELDASDSSEVEEPVTDQAQQTPREPSATEQNGEQEIPTRPQLPSAFSDSYETTSTISSEKTVIPQHPQQNPMERANVPATQTSPLNRSDPPALVVDTSSPEGNSPEASPSSDQVQTMSDSQRGGSSASKEPTWDDTKLRAFFDETDHIRDLLAVVYDKSNVEPAGSDHPIVGGLFREQNAKLAEITTQLDNMLGDWLARKQRLRGTI